MNKILCECHNISEDDVKQNIKNGITTYQELQDKTKIGTDCPSCKEQTSIIFQELLNEFQKAQK